MSDDLERFFRHLVHTLAASDPARLHRPVTLGEVHRQIIPYRVHRRALGLVTTDEYDLLLLRLAAGEGDLVRTEPEEIRLRLVQELRAFSPDLGLVYQFDDARLVLRREALARALGPGPEQAYAPREADADPSRFAPPGAADAAAPTAAPDPGEPDALTWVPEAADPIAEVPPPPPPIPVPVPAEAAAGPRCGYCGGTLPQDRTVNFCPHCGQSQYVNRCPECRSDVEAGWRYCVICGYPVSER